MSQNAYNEILQKLPLQPTTIKIHTYGTSQPLSTSGTFSAHFAFKDSSLICPVYVLASSTDTLISYDTANALGLIQMIRAVRPDKLSQSLQSHAALFQGTGKLHGTQVKFLIDDTVWSVVLPQRCIPFRIRKQVKENLSHLEQLDINEHVEGLKLGYLQF